MEDNMDEVSFEWDEYLPYKDIIKMLCKGLKVTLTNVETKEVLVTCQAFVEKLDRMGLQGVAFKADYQIHDRAKHLHLTYNPETFNNIIFTNNRHLNVVEYIFDDDEDVVTIGYCYKK